MFGRSHDEEEDRRELFGQRGDGDDHGRWFGRSDVDRGRDRDDDSDRSWFDRAKRNVRGWFRHDDEDSDDDHVRRARMSGDYPSDHPRNRYLPDEAREGRDFDAMAEYRAAHGGHDWDAIEGEDDLRDRRRPGRADHQVFGGRGLQAYDDPRAVRTDERARFGGQERSWVGGDESLHDERVRSRDAQIETYQPRYPHEYVDENHRQVANRNDAGYRAYRDDRGRRDYRDERDRGRDVRSSDRRSNDAGRNEQYMQRRDRREDERNDRFVRHDDRYMFRDSSHLDNARQIERHELRNRIYDREDDRSRRGDAFGRLRDDHGRYAGGPVPHDERHRFADTNDDARRNWQAWSGRSFHEHEYDRDRLARDERSRLAPLSWDEQHSHPSTRGNRLDYNEQWMSNTDRQDEDVAGRTRGRDDDQDRSFVPRDEYGRRRR